MKAIILSILFVSCSTSILFGQTELLNQFDSNGLKHGKWIVYLDADWNKVADSSTACYYRYAMFIHGGNLYPMARCGRKGYKLMENGIEIKCEVGKPKLLNGEYKWFDNKGRISSTHILENGIYKSYKNYYPNGQAKTEYAYTTQCGAAAEDYCLYLYDKNGKMTHKGPIPRAANGAPINKE